MKKINFLSRHLYLAEIVQINELGGGKSVGFELINY